MTRMTVNGQPVHYRMDPRTPLLWALRDASNLTGTKYGCGIGVCGACTVHIDGEAVRSCQVTLAEAEDADPSDDEIDAAITNLCRCGTYPRIREAIRLAARVARGEERLAAAPPPGIDPEDAARNVEALAPPVADRNSDPGRIRED
ncbi:MAG: 2Fe-2S iron-sulfur cluster binding domain-containing protein [Sphingomonadales bacterium]|nr:2Fe-2S iron-sulfur cluster binding domain-containing protein [Sphingomonadales bacterium]